MRGQAAMEFLITYGWAILILIASVGAFTYWGITRPDAVLPDQCLLTSGVVCSSYKVMNDAGQMRVLFTIENKLGKGIIVQRLNISSKNVATNCNIPSGLSVGPDQRQAFDCTLPTSVSLGEATSTGITITYLFLDGTYNRSLSGHMKAKAEGCPTGGCPAAGFTCALVSGQFCAGSAPANSQSASGSCAAGTSCFVCTGSYTWDGSSCALNPTCLLTAGQFCAGSAPANSYSGAGTCSSGSNCYGCNLGYTWNGATCLATSTCVLTAGQFCAASPPANSQAATGACITGSCYTCSPGYSWDGTTCAIVATFNYALSASGMITVPAGFSGNTSINATLTTGTSTSISFSASGLPSSATATFTPTSCIPNCSSVLNVTTTTATPSGVSTITVTGTTPVRTTTVAVNVTEKPVAYWKFDEGAGTTIGDSSGSHTGQLVSGATFAAGRKSTAASFDGVNDWAVIPDSAQLRVTNQTIAMWVYPRSLNTNFQTIVAKQSIGGVQRTFGFFIAPSSTTPHYAFQDSACSSWEYIEAGSMTLNAWNHIAGTYDQSVMKLYLNGVVVASRSTNVGVCQTTHPVVIGNASGYGYFNGSVDDLVIYNRSLSAAEIRAIMNS
jgi:hypothetical protein